MLTTDWLVNRKRSLEFGLYYKGIKLLTRGDKDVLTGNLFHCAFWSTNRILREEMTPVGTTACSVS